MRRIAATLTVMPVMYVPLDTKPMFQTAQKKWDGAQKNQQVQIKEQQPEERTTHEKNKNKDSQNAMQLAWSLSRLNLMQKKSFLQIAQEKWVEAQERKWQAQIMDQQAGGKPTDEKRTDEKPTDENPTDEKPIEEKFEQEDPQNAKQLMRVPSHPKLTQKKSLFKIALDKWAETQERNRQTHVMDQQAEGKPTDEKVEQGGPQNAMELLLAPSHHSLTQKKDLSQCAQNKWSEAQQRSRQAQQRSRQAQAKEEQAEGKPAQKNDENEEAKHEKQLTRTPSRKDSTQE